MNLFVSGSGDWTAAVVNHLWQSTVVVGIAWLLAWALRKNHARVRYCVWFAASLKFLLPFSLLMAAGEWMRSLMPASAMARPALANAMGQVTEPFAGARLFDAAPTMIVAHRGLLLEMNWWLAALLAVWVCGAMVVMGRFARGWWRVYAAKRAAIKTSNRRSFDCAWRGNAPGSAQDDIQFLTAQDESTLFVDDADGLIDVAADVPVLVTHALIEPGIFGIFRPVLLMPEGILGRLSPEQMRAIVAHEMCHVRRCDNLTFTIHMIVETLFWFHPLVWWIGARLVEERERACDEAVVQECDAAQVYAEGILNVCKFNLESPVECVTGVTGADLKKRIVRIVREQVGRKLTVGAKILIGVSALLAAGLPVAAGLGLACWSLAQSQSDDVVPNPPKFEVASIKPSRPDDPNDNWNGHGGELSIENYTLRRLIRMAYGLKSDSQVVGGPGWLDHQAFDIEAKFDETEAAKLRDMTGSAKFREYCFAVQSLIADRFRLKVHRDSQDRPIYALVVVRGGAKLANAAPTLDADGKPKAERDHTIHVSNGRMTATGISMSALADFLTGAGGDRVVLDRTDLTGDFDFKLDWSEDNGKGAPAVAQYPGLFTALQEQLGLKVEPEKGPVAVEVIDHVEQPTPN